MGEENFARNRDLWEKRSSRAESALSGGEDDEEDMLCSMEKRNESKYIEAVDEMPNMEEEGNLEPRPGPVLQTPDLVLDIPPGALADSPTVPLHSISRLSRSPSSESLRSTASESSSSVSLTITETFASVSDTIRKINPGSNLLPPIPPQSEVISIRSPRPKTPQPVPPEAAQVLMSTSSTFKPVLRVKPVAQSKENETNEDQE